MQTKLKHYYLLAFYFAKQAELVMSNKRVSGHILTVNCGHIMNLHVELS